MSRKSFLVCFFTSFVTACAVFLPVIIKNGGVFTVVDDFNTQQLPFSAAVWNAVRGGDPGQWNWNLDLGTSLISGFSFYNLGSPFFWISLLFPKGSFPYLAGYLYIAKYVAASLSAFLYLRCFSDNPKNEKYAVVGALLYAFSGFQTTNLEFFHFHDVVAFFPLLLWGIENVDDRKKHPAFAAAVFLNCLVNYFFFVQEAVFMVLYFLVRYWGTSFREFLRRMLTCLLCGVLGVGMASVLFVPSVLYIMGNDRSEMALYLGNFVYDAKTLLFVLKGILLPGDSMRDPSALIPFNYTSTSCYLPLFGLSLVLPFLKKDHSWIRKLLCILFVITLFPFMNSGFLLFREVNRRWWYMLVLILVLASVRVLEKPEEYPVSKGIWIYFAAVTVFCLCVRMIPWDRSHDQIIFHEDRFLYFYVIAAAGVVLLDLLRRTNLLQYPCLLCLTMAACALTTGVTLHFYREDTDSKAYIRNYEASVQLETLDDQYRYRATDNETTLTGGAAGVGAFSSTMEISSYRFDKLFDINTGNLSADRWEIPGLPQLLGGKYAITSDPNAENIVSEVSTPRKVAEKAGKQTIYVTEGEAFPIGFSLDHYILASELVSLPAQQRALALMHAAVVYPQDVEKVSSVMDHLDLTTVDFERPVEELIAAAEPNRVQDFSRSSHGFSCSTAYGEDRMVYFTVPNDDGWTAAVDGVETEVVDSGGMMLVRVPAGSHRVVFTYETPGLKAGDALSVLSWLVFAVLSLSAAGLSPLKRSAAGRTQRKGSAV